MLTEKQADLQAQDPDNMPTLREIAAAKREAKSTIQGRLRCLVERGFITIGKKPRSLRVIRTADNIPVFEKEAS